MATVYDTVSYILKMNGRMTAMKLQKLVYYCQAWSLVWDERPIFKERIEAWSNGPVVPELYELHRHEYTIETIDQGNADSLTTIEADTVDAAVTTVLW